MKKINCYISLFLLSIASAFAQVDRSQYPAPGPAPQINIGEAESFTLDNGLKVFVVENHKLPRVAYSLVLDRDPLFEGDKAGLTSLVGNMMMGGTTSKSKDEIDESIDMIGGRISFSSSSANASSLTKYQDQLLSLFTDILLNPVFPQEELEKLKKQELSGIASSKDDPNAIMSNVSNAVLYGKDTPYGETETEATVKNIGLDDVKQYYSSYYKPNIAYLAIVGDINVKQAKELINKYLGAWKKGDVPQHAFTTKELPTKREIALVNRPTSVQSIVKLAYPVDLKPNDPNVIPAAIVNNILGGGSAGRLFQKLREEKGYTYGAYSSLSPSRYIGNFSASASVRTEVTDSAALALVGELEKLGQKTITQAELDDAKATLMGNFGRSLEQPSTIASFAINSELNKLPKDFYKNYLKNIDAVTLEQANTLAPSIISADKAYLIIVGNTDAFADKVTQLGEVKFYDIEGNPEVKVAVDDASITAQGIVDKYIAAIGGKEKLSAVKRIAIVNETELQGMKLGIESYNDEEKELAIQEVKMGDQLLSKVVTTKEKTIMTQQGQSQEAPAEMHNTMVKAIQIFPELHYAENKATLELDGISKVNGEDAYKVKVTPTDGGASVNYYSVSSGLKLKSESASSGEAEYKVYKEYEGIQLPVSSVVKNPGIPMPLELTTTTVVINGPERSE
ncbi:M16 family metallopeptidase [Olivibacter sitiensis]|uniref:M16 family metallopeptidase n=1 Tax=Olivibacter sitiensis TaxID=376470 RepID=UPI000427D100|nr:pitrilysin family protein [Olivibacter sitiensis]